MKKTDNIHEIEFSVVIPLFNKKTFISRAVRSVLSQTFTQFELIIIDDGSTDGSCDAIYDIDDHRIKIIHQKNAGTGAARTRGMIESSKEWIAFLDADDFWLPDHLMDLANLSDKFPNAGLISGATVESNNGTIPSSLGSNLCNYREIDYFLVITKSPLVVNSSSVAIRAKVFNSLGAFTSYRLGQDIEYWARVSLNFPVAISDKVTSIYCRNTGGVVQKYEQKRGDKIKVIKALKDLSPSVEMLCLANEKNNKIFMNPSVRTYINSKLFKAIKFALYLGDVVGARSYKSFFLKPVSLKMQILFGGLKLPKPLIHFGLGLYRYSKIILR